MSLPVEAIVLLCDAAVTDGAGKVHMLGAGWSVTGSPTPPSAVAVFLKIPWDRANEALPTSLTLVDADGQPVRPDGEHVVGTHQHIEVGRPAGLAHGTPIDVAFSLSLGPIPLAPGRYQWRLDVAGEVHSAGFTVAGQNG